MTIRKNLFYSGTFIIIHAIYSECQYGKWDRTQWGYGERTMIHFLRT